MMTLNSALMAFDIFSFNLSVSSRPEMMWVHAVIEILMAFSFFFLAIRLCVFLWQRRDLKFRAGVLFAVFFLLLGVIHTAKLSSLWYPIYGLERIVALFTAIVALAVVIGGRRWLVKAVSFIHPEQTETQMQKMNEEMERVRGRESDLLKTQSLMNREHQEKLKAAVQRQEILEKEIRDAGNEVGLLAGLSHALGKTSDFSVALEMTVHQICERMGWDYGEVWTVSENGKTLECGPAWYGDSRFEELRNISKDIRLPLHLDLAGQIWASQKPQYIQDIFAEANGTFMRVALCQKLGFRGAIGIPVFKNGKVFAVMVFLMREFQQQDKHRMPVVTAAAAVLTNSVEKAAMEKILENAQELQEKRVRERTRELLKIKENLETRIQKHEETEEVLRRSQQDFSTLLNSIDGIVWEYDLRASKFTFVSSQAEKILGYPVQGWFSDPAFWQDHIHGGDRAQALAFRAHVAHEKRDDRYEYRMITADGRTIWLRDLVSVVVENDEAIKLRGVMVNITESKQVAEALIHEQNFVSAIFDTASAIVLVLDANGRVVRCNRACSQTSGYSSQELNGKVFWDLFSSPEEVNKTKTIFTRLVAGQFPITDENYWIAKDGTRRAISWSNTVLLNKYGAVIHVIATGTDITKRKEIEQELTRAVADLARSNRDLDKSSQEIKEANHRLRELDQIKSRFISAASHELRTPLTSIKGYVEAILEDEVGPLNEKQKEFLTYVKSSTDRLHRLLNELLDISKIESGQIKMNKELIRVRELLREEVMSFQPQAQQKNIQLVAAVDMQLREIYCDGDKIREVMDNLLSNAVKYTPSGGKIRVEAKNFEDGVQIEVHDTGIGISKEDLPRIFEPFQYIEKEGVESGEESTGLGLTLVRRIVEAHDGRIRVKSEDGKGSIFTVILPMGKRSENTMTTSWGLVPSRYE